MNGFSDEDDDLSCQESCLNCGDEARHLLNVELVPWSKTGDALCRECGASRGATASAACCLVAPECDGEIATVVSNATGVAQVWLFGEVFITHTADTEEAFRLRDHINEAFASWSERRMAAATRDQTPDYRDYQETKLRKPCSHCGVPRGFHIDGTHPWTA